MIKQIVNIHNTLCEVKTSGEDTIKMAQCLLALRQLAQELQQKEEEEEDANNNK